MRSSPPVSRTLEVSSLAFSANGLAAAPSVWKRLKKGCAATSAGPVILALLPRLSKNLAGAGGERADVLEGLVDARRGLAEVGERGGGLIGEFAQALHRGAEFAQERREQREVLGQRAAVARGGARHRVALHDEVGHLAAHLGPGFEHAVAFFGQVGQHLVLGGQDAKHGVEFAQRRVGVADDRVQIAAAARQAGAEFVEDDRQPFALGAAADVAHEVDVDGAGGVFEGHVVLPRPFPAGWDGGQRRRQRRADGPFLGGNAVDVLLADQRLDLDRAGGVGAEVLEAGVFDVQRDRRPGLRRGHHFAHDARLDAVDQHVLAGDQVAGVVEDGAHGVAPARTPRGGRKQDRCRQSGCAQPPGYPYGPPSPPDGLRPQPRILPPCQ